MASSAVRSIPRLSAEVRAAAGTHYSRLLRGSGRVPGILHSRRRQDEERILLSFNHKELAKFVRDDKFFNTVYDVDVAGVGIFRAIPRCHARHFMYSDKTVNITFMIFEPFTRHLVQIPIVIDNADICKGSKRGGFLCVNQRCVKCFWSGDENIPASIHIDVRDLDIGDAVHSTNLKIPDGLAFEDPKHLYSFVSVLGSKGLTEEEAVAAGAAATPAAKATPAKT